MLFQINASERERPQVPSHTEQSWWVRRVLLGENAGEASRSTIRVASLTALAALSPRLAPLPASPKRSLGDHPPRWLSAQPHGQNDGQHYHRAHVPDSFADWGIRRSNSILSPRSAACQNGGKREKKYKPLLRSRQVVLN